MTDPNYMPWHKRFEDVVLDLRKLAMLDGNMVILDDGTKRGVSDKAADAIRRYFTPASAKEQNEPSRGTCDTAQEARPESPSLPSAGDTAEGPSAARARLQCPTSPLTSSPAEGSAKEEDGTGSEKGKEKEP